MNKTGNSQLLNLTLIFAIASLVGLIIYGNRFQHRYEEHHIETGTSTQTAHTPQTPQAPTRHRHTDNRSPYTLAPPAESPLAGIKHPKKTGPTNQIHHPDTPNNLQQMADQQAQDIRRAPSNPRSMDEDKHDHDITPEELQELMKRGTLIY